MGVQDVRVSKGDNVKFDDVWEMGFYKVMS